MSTLELGGLAKSQVAHTGPGTYVGSQSRSLNHAHLYIVAMHLSGQLNYREALTGLTIGTSWYISCGSTHICGFIDDWCPAADKTAKTMSGTQPEH